MSCVIVLKQELIFASAVIVLVLPVVLHIFLGWKLILALDAIMPLLLAVLHLFLE